MNVQAARETHKKAIEALQALGFQVDASSPRYSSNSVTFKVTLIESSGPLTALESKEVRDFRAHAIEIGFQPSDLNREFVAQYKKYKLVGYMPRCWKSPMLVEDVNGKRWKMDVDTVKRAIGTKMSELQIIAELRSVECALSPENLTCDGEASSEHIQRESSRLNRRKTELINMLGRQPTSKELYG